jgi:hypothetical protein
MMFGHDTRFYTQEGSSGSLQQSAQACVAQTHNAGTHPLASVHGVALLVAAVAGDGPADIKGATQQAVALVMQLHVYAWLLQLTQLGLLHPIVRQYKGVSSASMWMILC